MRSRRCWRARGPSSRTKGSWRRRPTTWWRRSGRSRPSSRSSTTRSWPSSPSSAADRVELPGGRRRARGTPREPHGARPVADPLARHAAVRPAADVSVDPRHRHERQGDRGARGGGARVCARAHDGPVHVAAPRVRPRAALRVRGRHHGGGVRRGIRASAAVPDAGRLAGRGAGHVLRGAERARVPVVRGQAGGARRVRGGDGGHVGRDEPGARRRRRPDPDRARPSGAGLHDRGGGGREGGHHQGGHHRGEPRAGRRRPRR